MAIVQTLTFSQFCDAFAKMERQDQFSYDGKRVLFDYLEEYSDSMGEDVDLDIIALCCDYSEDNLKDIIDNYSIDVSEAKGDADELEYIVHIVREYLEENTIIIGEVPGGFVYAVF